jgi:hypothetical protein
MISSAIAASPQPFDLLSVDVSVGTACIRERGSGAFCEKLKLNRVRRAR